MVPVSMLAPRIFRVMLCELISSPCQGEDAGEGPCAARDFFAARLGILRSHSSPARFFNLCVIATRVCGAGAKKSWAGWNSSSLNSGVVKQKPALCCG